MGVNTLMDSNMSTQTWQIHQSEVGTKIWIHSEITIPPKLIDRVKEIWE